MKPHFMQNLQETRVIEHVEPISYITVGLLFKKKKITVGIVYIIMYISLCTLSVFVIYLWIILWIV